LEPIRAASPPEEDPVKKAKWGLQAVKTTASVARELRGSNPQMALGKALIGGLKLAADTEIDNPLISPLRLAALLKELGLDALAWEPETLMVELDRKYHNWTSDRIVQALDHFHKTGLLDTEVQTLVRQKLYAIRLVATTDAPHTEWNIFEKVGGAFNDRVANFGLVEPLSAAECARTVMMIENIRPDSYTNEIKIYIAACCFESGLYTVEPIRALSMSEAYLNQMISDSRNEPYDTSLKQQIIAKFKELGANVQHLREVSEDVASVQAIRLIAVEHQTQSGTLAQ